MRRPATWPGRWWRTSPPGSRSSERRAATLPADGVHGPQGLDEAGRVDLVPLPLGVNASPDYAGDLFRGGAPAQQGLDVRLVQGEKAVAELAVGGQAEAVATQAEGPGDRGDDAHPAAAVGVPEVHG